jgi:hypothetical protein
LAGGNLTGLPEARSEPKMRLIQILIGFKMTNNYIYAKKKYINKVYVKLNCAQANIKMM